MMADKGPLNLSTLKCSVVKFRDGFLNVPVFLLDAFNLLYCGGIKNEGIFRKSGNLARIKNMKYPFYGDFGCPEGTTCFDVCHLIKQFFRELDEPLFTDALEPQFLQFQVLSLEMTRIKYVLELCHVLPPRHRETLAYLMRKLKHVAEFSEHNKMDAKNLAIVFAPCIFAKNCPPLELMANNLEQMEKSKKDNDAKVNLVEILIERADEIGALSEYEKVMSPDMYDKLLPEDRRNVESNSNGRGRPRKSQTFSSKNDGSTPVSSKSKSTLTKRKSTTDAGSLFNGASDQTADKNVSVVAKVSHVVPAVTKSPKKHRSSYSMTMKNLTLMARREVDMRDIKDVKVFKKTAENLDEDQLAPPPPKKYERRNSNVNRRRSAARSKRQATKQELPIEEITANDDIEQNSAKGEAVLFPTEQPNTDVSSEIVESNFDREVHNLIEDVVELTVRNLNEILLTNDEANFRDPADNTPMRELLRGHSTNLGDRTTMEVRHDSVPRSQSESTGIGKVSTLPFEFKDRRRVQTSPRKKLKRNVANVKSIRRVVKPSSRKSTEAPFPLTLTAPETVYQNYSMSMDFENSDARRELLLQQTENTESAIIDIKPTGSMLSAIPVTCEHSPAALHRPSVAFIVERRRGIVRQQTAKFETMSSQQLGNLAKSCEPRSPSKLTISNDVAVAANQHDREKPSSEIAEDSLASEKPSSEIAEDSLASGGSPGSKREKFVSFSPSIDVLEVPPSIEPRRTSRIRPQKSYRDMVNMVESPTFATPNDPPKIKKPLKRLTNDSPVGKSKKKYPDSPLNPLKTSSKKIIQSSIGEKV